MCCVGFQISFEVTTQGRQKLCLLLMDQRNDELRSEETGDSDWVWPVSSLLWRNRLPGKRRPGTETSIQGPSEHESQAGILRTDIRVSAGDK